MNSKAGRAKNSGSKRLSVGVAAMDEDWQADVDADLLDNGLYAPVLVVVPPPSVGPPIRRRLGGEYAHPELAKMAALDAFVEMSRR